MKCRNSFPSVTRTAFACALLSSGALFAQTTPQLQAMLAKLDAASAKFSNAQASFHNEDYTALVRDTSVQDGIIYTVRLKSGDSEVGIKVVGPGARIVQYKNGVVKDFNPGTACYNSVSAAKNHSTIESFLTLAFGTSGRELAKAWTITDLGPETLTDDGKPVKVEKLSLVSNDAGVRNSVDHIVLWTDLERGVSLKLIIYSSQKGDTHTATYSHIRLDAKKVDTKPFEFKDKPCGK